MQDPQQPPVFDPGPFKELMEVGGPELVHELCELFLTDTPNIIDELEAAVESEDWETMGRAAHTLKSSAFYLGALALSNLAKSIEVLAGDDPVAGAALAAEPRRAFVEVSGALTKACEELPPA
ncbi:MAG: Hpt domain-containing protein [Planctomycetota bacterium]|nr:Hpt domain-containing protein [Planctomycetota bacterium]